MIGIWYLCSATAATYQRARRGELEPRPRAVRVLDEPLSDGARLALCGGLATYLIGNAAFQLRIAGEVGFAKLAGILGMLCLFALGGDLSALGVTAAATLVLAVLCALETREAEPTDTPGIVRR